MSEEEKQLYTLKKYNHKSGTIYHAVFHFKTWNYDSVEAINLILDQLEETEGPIGLITSSDHPKIYSAGLHFEMFVGNRTATPKFIMVFQRMLSRFIQTGFPTIAALNGHCIAGGIMFAMSHDFRVQREDLGRICLSELNLKAPIPLGMLKVIQVKVSPKVILMTCLGQEFSPRESLEANLVDKLAPLENLIEIAQEMIAPFVPKSVARDAYASIKRTMYKDAIWAFRKEFLPDYDLREKF